MGHNDLMALRVRLEQRREALIARLAADDALEAAFVALLADTHTAIAAVDAVFETGRLEIVP
ncbi:MAG TPA: hypothetical protein VGC80_00880 [Acetobacteraceae bacterium]